MMETSNGKESAPVKRGRKRSRDKELEPLREAVRQVSAMICEFSSERDYFVSDGTSQKRRLDTKALKEFASVLKEICSVVCELDGSKDEKSGSVRIEFSGEALDFSE